MDFTLRSESPVVEFRFPDEQEVVETVSSNEDESGEFMNALDSFRQGMKQIWPGSGVSQDELDDLEAALLRSDVSMETVEKIIEPLRQNPDISSAEEYLRETVGNIFDTAGSRSLIKARDNPSVYFFIGVNGSGKTTSMAKLAHMIQPDHDVLFAAGDTFRAAAIDQLNRWGEELEIEVIAHEKGGDPSAVVFDAVDAAINRDVDFLFVDTAGRLHTRGDLMLQLKKMIEVTEKKIDNAPHESLLVLDASTGQNGLRQTKRFADELPVTGITLTKMDSTAKGGIALTVADELKVPVKLIGTGEELDDLVQFSPEVYCDSLLQRTSPSAS
jgi:fused signal recognition particle receptor